MIFKISRSQEIQFITILREVMLHFPISSISLWYFCKKKTTKKTIREVSEI